MSSGHVADQGGDHGFSVPIPGQQIFAVPEYYKVLAWTNLIALTVRIIFSHSCELFRESEQSADNPRLWKPKTTSERKRLGHVADAPARVQIVRVHRAAEQPRSAPFSQAVCLSRQLA